MAAPGGPRHLSITVRTALLLGGSAAAVGGTLYLLFESGDDRGQRATDDGPELLTDRLSFPLNW